MSKLNNVLTVLGQVGSACVIIAEASKKVISLFGK